MASEITEEEDETPSCIQDKEAEKQRIRQIIEYQKSLYLSSSSCSSSSTSSTASTSFSKSSSLLDLMKKGGSTSLRRLFDMEHTSLGNYLKDYSVSFIIKPILLWGSDSDNDLHDDPWADMKHHIGGDFGSRIGGQNGEFTSEGGFNGEDFVQHRKRVKTNKRKLMRTKSYKKLPRFRFWRCGVFKFRLKLIRKLRVIVRGRLL